MTTLIYYCEDDQAIYFLKKKTPDHCVLIGTIATLPAHPAFVVQSLLTNAGFHDITVLSFVYGERQPLTQETMPHDQT